MTLAKGRDQRSGMISREAEERGLPRGKGGGRLRLCKSTSVLKRWASSRKRRKVDRSEKGGLQTRDRGKGCLLVISESFISGEDSEGRGGPGEKRKS